MPREAKGELIENSEGFSARITLEGRTRKTFKLATGISRADAEERTETLARLSHTFRRAKMASDPTVVKLLDMAAAASKALLPGILQTAAELAGGELVTEGMANGCLTFREVADQWTSGKLHRDYPDHVRAKDSDLDESRLKLLSGLDVGGLELGQLPVNRFTLSHAETAMRKLPERAKRPGTRRQYAQLIARVLSLAVYPLRLIAANPLPRGFMPKVGKPPTFPYLYPDEDQLLLSQVVIPLGDRFFYGFLTREGIRAGEAINLQWRDLDLERGTVSLDRNKTNDARTWALGSGVCRALRAWHDRRKPKATELVFLDGEGCPFDVTKIADHLRSHLTTAHVDRNELHHDGTNRRKLRAHDLRGTFVTLALANGKTESWVADRTGHKSSQMINRYRRSARSAKELGLGPLTPLDLALPDLRIPDDCPTETNAVEPEEAQVTEIVNKAEVAELADAADSKSVVRKDLWVRFPPSAQFEVCRPESSFESFNECIRRKAGFG